MANMATKAQEAVGVSPSVRDGRPFPASFPRGDFSRPSPRAEARPVRLVGVRGPHAHGEEEEESGYPAKTIRQLARVNLVVSSVIFLCLLVMAVCLCRPVVIMGGLWVGILVLVQAILGLRVADAAISHSLTVGYAWLSGAVCVMGLATAAYLFSGHLTLACVSSFHRLDHASVIRLYVVEVVAVVASLPCLVSTIVSLLAAALSARAACPPKQKPEAPFVLYLPRWGGSAYGSDRQTVVQSRAGAPVTSPPPTTSSPPPSNERRGRGANSPPPAYNQIAEESFA